HDARAAGGRLEAVLDAELDAVGDALANLRQRGEAALGVAELFEHVDVAGLLELVGKLADLGADSRSRASRIDSFMLLVPMSPIFWPAASASPPSSFIAAAAFAASGGILSSSRSSLETLSPRSSVAFFADSTGATNFATSASRATLTFRPMPHPRNGSDDQRR